MSTTPFSHRPHPEEAHNPDPAVTPHSVYVREYRDVHYFLEDQLQCSQVVQDFQSLKSLLNNTSYFSLRGAFQFCLEPVPVRIRD